MTRGGGKPLTCGLLLHSEADMAFMFENLLVYQKAVDFADQIACTTGSFRGYYFLTDQLNRAALSIATNLADGWRKMMPRVFVSLAA